MNCLGEYVQQEMAWRGWGLAQLAAESGLDEDELLGLFAGEGLVDWPSARIVRALAHGLGVPVQGLVLLAAEASGLAVGREVASVDLSKAGNEELMRELRRRLALGASTGSYLATRSSSHLVPVPRAQVG